MLKKIQISLFFPKKLGYIIKQFCHVYLIVFHEQRSQYHSQTNNYRILHSCHSCKVYKYDVSFHFSEEYTYLHDTQMSQFNKEKIEVTVYENTCT